MSSCTGVVAALATPVLVEVASTIRKDTTVVGGDVAATPACRCSTSWADASPLLPALSLLRYTATSSQPLGLALSAL
eukprot:scaffold7594_cov417-Prasinococcus_capsulatus_cf.AAC.2